MELNGAKILYTIHTDIPLLGDFKITQTLVSTWIVMALLSGFGVATGSVIAVLGSAGLTVGMALQGSLSNFAGGVLILLMKPFSVGDYIVDGSSGTEGTVKDINLFYTRLLTIDNKMVMIPNGKLADSCLSLIHI